MSKYVPAITYNTTFQGDDVVALLEPLSRGQFIQTSSALEKAARLRSMAKAAKEGQVQDAAEMETLIAAVSAASIAVLTENLTSITGVKDHNGSAVSKETILAKVFFMDLVNELFNTLVERAILGEASSVDSAVR